MPHIIHLAETISTNTYLKELIQSRTLEDGTAVYTDFQVAGRGQRGNSWEAEQGKNLLLSMVLFPKMIKANEQFIISQIVSLALKDVLTKYTNEISIKWPNDIYWQDKKICGILIENALLDAYIQQSIIGIGLNINQNKFESNAPNPISLKQIIGKNTDIETVLHELLTTILIYYQDLKQGNTEHITKRYKQALYRKEGYHAFNDGEETFLARIKDIEPIGLLVLETKEGETRKFAFKEVSYII